MGRSAKKQKPLVVYLDSSDLSVLAESSESPACSTAGILKQLRELVADKQVIFPISLIHILEMLHTDRKYRDVATRRARVAKELSSRTAFRWVSDIFEDDASTLLGIESRSPSDYAVSKTGDWLPSAIDNKFAFVSEFRTSIRKRLVNVGSSRNERRSLDKQLFRQNQLRPEAIPLVRTALESTYAELKTVFPLTDRFYSEDFLLQLLTKRKSERDVCEELRKGLCDPEHFVGWYVDLIDPERSVVGSLRNVASQVSSQINAVREMARMRGVSRIDTRSIAAKFNPASEEFRTQLGKKMYSKRSGAIRRAGISRKSWKRTVLDSKHGDLPGLDTFLDILGYSYLEDASTHSTSGDVQDSSVVDWLHGMYLPYVDFLRADRATAHRLKAATPKHRARVVERLAMLPGAILSRLPR